VPKHIIKHEAGQTVGMASANRAADAAQNTPPPIDERIGTPMTGSLVALSAVMVLVALGLVKFLFRRTYAKRVLALGAMRRSQRPPDAVRPVDLPLLDLSSGLRNQVEAEPSVASSLESVKKALDTIEEAVAEMAPSRQLRTRL
jgi:hypothetical protein